MVGRSGPDRRTVSKCHREKKSVWYKIGPTKGKSGSIRDSRKEGGPVRKCQKRGPSENEVETDRLREVGSPE